MCCFAFSAKVFADWSSVGAAGGAQAQSGSKRGMNSCDALLCILSVSCRGGRRVSKWREVARSEFVCCFALFAKVFADWRSVLRRLGRRYGCATKYVLQDSIRLLRCGDGSLSPWTFGYGYSVYDCSGSCKDTGHRAYAAKSVCQFYMRIPSGFLTKGRDNRLKSR